MSRSDRDRTNVRLELPSLPCFGRHVEAESSIRPAQTPGGTDHNDQAADSRMYERRLERERSQSLSDSDMETLTDIGTFRALAFEDLALHRYAGHLDETRKHLGTLARQGLVRSRTSYPGRAVYVTLTRAGYRLVAGSGERGNPRQRLYHGFVKIRQARHDAALYRLYRQESACIEHTGGRVRRVILGFELQQSISRRLAKLKGLPDAEQVHNRHQIAQEHGLALVKGKIPVPDLRLEYEGPDQQLAKVDLELVTHHYHHDHLLAKAQAGFAMYAFAEDAARLAPAMQDPEIMQEILSL